MCVGLKWLRANVDFSVSMTGGLERRLILVISHYFPVNFEDSKVGNLRNGTNRRAVVLRHMFPSHLLDLM